MDLNVKKTSGLIHAIHVKKSYQVYKRLKSGQKPDSETRNLG